MPDFQNLIGTLSRIANMETVLYMLLEDAVKGRDLERISALTEFGRRNRGTSELVGQLLNHLKAIEESFENLSEDDQRMLRDLSESVEVPAETSPAVSDGKAEGTAEAASSPAPNLAPLPMAMPVPKDRREDVKEAAWGALRAGVTATAEIAKAIRDATGLSVNGRVVQGYRSAYQRIALKLGQATSGLTTEESAKIREVVYGLLRKDEKASTEVLLNAILKATGLKVTGRQINAWRTAFKRYERK